MRQRIILLTMAVAGVLSSPAQLKDDNGVNDRTLDSLEKARTARPYPGSTRRGANPVLFLVGNSTMRNGTLGNGNNGQWGWGYCAPKYFDREKITVENQALGGTSSRTFYKRLWPDIRKALKKGDWVIISIGHNDNGPYDSGRARASIPGIGKDSLIVTIKETGAQDTVYSYGEYMRRFIRETRAKGANPILMSLTPRDAYDADGKIQRKQNFTDWLTEVAKEENVPFVNLNEISARKLDKYGRWKESYHFYKDHIHSSLFGAEMNAESAAEGIMSNEDPQLEPLKAMMTPLSSNVAEKRTKPRVFITGDSTVKNADKDEDGMWGWGSQASLVFNSKKIDWENDAMAGRSTRSYLNEGRWKRVYDALQPGDFVLIEFGHNDIGEIGRGKDRGTWPTGKDSCAVVKRADGHYELVYSFGFYLKKFIQDVREKGATPILVSLTPRNEWKDGHIERRNDTYGKWYREVVDATGVEFVDLHNIAADYYDRHSGSKEKAQKYFKRDHTHTSLLGARTNAKCVKKGLKATSLKPYLR